MTASNVNEWKFVFFREVDHILDELVCFHTKLTFEEDVLGVLLKYTVNPATQKVDYVSYYYSFSLQLGFQCCL